MFDNDLILKLTQPQLQLFLFTAFSFRQHMNLRADAAANQLVLNPDAAGYQNSPVARAGYRTGVVFVVGSVRPFHQCVYRDVVHEKTWRYVGRRLKWVCGVHSTAD